MTDQPKWKRQLSGYKAGIMNRKVESETMAQIIYPPEMLPSPDEPGEADIVVYEIPDWFVQQFMTHRHFWAAKDIDIVARKDGKEYRLEGDWLKEACRARKRGK